MHNQCQYNSKSILIIPFLLFLLRTEEKNMKAPFVIDWVLFSGLFICIPCAHTRKRIYLGFSFWINNQPQFPNHTSHMYLLIHLLKIIIIIKTKKLLTSCQNVVYSQTSIYLRRPHTNPKAKTSKPIPLQIPVSSHNLFTKK